METVVDTTDALAPADPGARENPYKSALILFNPKAGSVSAADGEKLIEAVKAAGVEQFALLGPVLKRCLHNCSRGQSSSTWSSFSAEMEQRAPPLN
jgi:hypothetical protein